MTRSVQALRRFASNRALRASCLSACLVFAGTAAAFSKALPVLFPVNMEAPVSSSRIGFAKDGDALLIQPIRFLTAVRTKAEIPVHFQSSFGQVIGGAGPKWDFVVPEGSLLIGAVMGIKPVFCTSKILDDSFVTHYDVAICAADADGDGKLDQLFLSDDGMHRIRSVAEIKLLNDDAMTPIATPYESVVVGDLPALELQVALAYTGNFLTKIERVYMGICWSDSLTLPSPGNEVSISCGATNWKSISKRGPLSYNLTARPADDLDGQLIWGPVSVTLTGKGSSMKGEATSIPPGKAVFLDIGETMLDQDTRQETAIFRIQTLPPDAGAAKRGAPI